MLFFQKRFHAGLLDGSVKLTFRRWKRPLVKPDKLYRVHPIGVVLVSELARVRFGEVRDGEARLAGFNDRAEMKAWLDSPVKLRDGAVRQPPPIDDLDLVFRVKLRYAGLEDRIPAALEAKLNAQEVATIAERLRRLDARLPWTRTTLSLIGRNPRVAASHLARSVGRETEPFKSDVRKLKALGLTVSYEVGYAVSPRGKAFLKKKKVW